MAFLYVVINLTHFGEFGAPSRYILPILWVLGIAAETALQLRFPHSKKRNLITWSALGLCVVCEVSLIFIRSATAFVFILLYHVAVGLLLASLVGKLLCRLVKYLVQRRG